MSTKISMQDGWNATLRNCKEFFTFNTVVKKENAKPEVQKSVAVHKIAIVTIAVIAAYWIIGVRGFIGFIVGASYAKSTDLQDSSTKAIQLIFQKIKGSTDDELEAETPTEESQDEKLSESLPIFKAVGDTLSDVIEPFVFKKSGEES